MWSHEGLPGSSAGKESVCNAENPGSIPGLGRSPGGGHGNPLQYSFQENSIDRGAWQANGVTESETTERLSVHTWSHELLPGMTACDMSDKGDSSSALGYFTICHQAGSGEVKHGNSTRDE